MAFRRSVSRKNPIAIREQHYERHFGQMSDEVAHSMDNGPIHTDIYQFEPNGTRPYWTLVTGGMSDLPQCIPPAAKGFAVRRAEIFMYAAAPQPWMRHILKTLAEFPSRGKTFLSRYHTWTNGGRMGSPSSQLTSYIFLPPFLEQASINTLQIQGEPVDLLWMVPITEREREHAIRVGSDALADLLIAAGIDLIIREDRESIM